MTTHVDEYREFLHGAEALGRGEIGGVEVAMRPMPSIGQLLIASLVHHRGENLSLELARWVADANGLGVPVTATLRLPASADIAEARELLARAEVALPGSRLESDGAALLATGERLVV